VNFLLIFWSLKPPPQIQLHKNNAHKEKEVLLKKMGALPKYARGISSLETILFADTSLESKLIYGEEQKLQSGRELFPRYLAIPQKP